MGSTGTTISGYRRKAEKNIRPRSTDYSEQFDIRAIYLHTGRKLPWKKSLRESEKVDLPLSSRKAMSSTIVSSPLIPGGIILKIERIEDLE